MNHGKHGLRAHPIIPLGIMEGLLSFDVISDDGFSRREPAQILVGNIELSL
jgi:hypothetical protein